jgi:phospholipase A1
MIKIITVLLVCSVVINANAHVISSKKHTVKKSVVKEKTVGEKVEGLGEDIKTAVSSLSPTRKSALEHRRRHEFRFGKNPYGLAFYEPTYIIPFYYTQMPYRSVYAGSTPNNQRIDNFEFKGKLSLKMPIIRNIFHTKTDFNIAYTQLLFWQFYARSQYFRETDYSAEVQFTRMITHNWLGTLGMLHQSNGRGGQFERSWNRAFIDFTISGEHWIINARAWMLIFQSSSSDLHNRDIASYLGHGRLVLAYKIHDNEISLNLRNNVESLFTRGAVEFNWTFPIYGRVRGIFQVFSGYGQSLIEYDHYTNSVGLGVSMSDWT